MTVTPLTPHDDVARMISKYDLLAVPVVDRAGQVIGIVTVDDVIDKLVDDATNEVQRFGGNEALDMPYTRAINSTPSDGALASIDLDKAAVRSGAGRGDDGRDLGTDPVSSGLVTSLAQCFWII